jgi:hypothetical protein
MSRPRSADSSTSTLHGNIDKGKCIRVTHKKKDAPHRQRKIDKHTTRQRRRKSWQRMEVANEVGAPISVIDNEGNINPTPYLRATVWLDLNKPLVRVVPITLKERMMYLVQLIRETPKLLL